MAFQLYDLLHNITTAIKRIRNNDENYIRPRRLHNWFNVNTGTANRPTTADVPSDNYGGMRKFLATGSMSSRPDGADGHIVQLDWDNSDVYASQLYIPNSSGLPSYREQLGSADWSGSTPWFKFITQKNPWLAHYANSNGSNAGKYYKITINAKTSWMLNFTVKLYHKYNAYDLQISGYNYGANHWYSPSAVVLGSNVTTALTVYFGYAGTNDLWVAIPAEQYTGIGVYNYCNGYTQVNTLQADLFTITMENSLPSTIQAVTTAYRPWYRDETVTNATNATNASTVNNKTVGANVPSNGFTDYVVLNTTATKNSATWRYREWNSGVIELWGSKTASVAHYANYSGQYYFYVDLDFPITLKTIANVQGNAQVATQMTTSTILDSQNTVSKCRVYAAAGVSGTQSVTARVYVMGTWK